jgi:signal transduction histidine kinase/ActR/RegA family two-component response regulator
MGEFITLSAAVMATCLTVLVHFRRPPSAFWPTLFIVYLSVALWAFGELFTTYISADQQWYWMWLVIQYMGILGLPAAWWILTLRYAETCGHPVRWAGWPARYGPIAFAAIFWVILITNPIHRQFLIVDVHTANQRGALWYVLAAENYAVILASIAILAWLSWKSLRTDRAAQVRILLFGALLPLVSNFLYITKIVDFGFDMTVGAFSLLALVFFFGIYRHRLFALSSVTLNHVVFNEPDAFIITDQNGRVCFANASAESLFGTGSALLDTTVFPILDAVFERTDVPGAQPGFAGISNPDNPAGTLASGDVLRLRGTSKRFAFQKTTIPGWRNEIRGVGVRLIDITVAEKAKRQLSEQASAMEAILGSVMEGILVVDHEGKMIYFNDVFQEMWKLPDHILAKQDDERAIQHVLKQLVDPDRFVARIQELYESPEKTSNQDEIALKDGLIFERSSRPLFNDDLPIGRVWTFRDVTAIRNEAEERRQLELKVLEAQKLDSLGMMAGGIAHDFNNLLVGVLGNAELALQEAPEDSKLHQQLDGISKASRRAGELCRQLLAYSGHGQIVVIPADLSELVEDMASLLSVSVSRQCQLKMNLADALPAVEADVTQLRQVIMNLTTNASEAVGDAAGTVSVRTGTKMCSREDLADYIADDDIAPGAYVYVEVEDSGCGIEHESLKQMFEPFFSTKFAGRGLGLAAVRGIARSHRAVIAVSSELGSGTCIRVLFPASAAEAKTIREDVLVPVQEDVEGTVLVVDDEPDVLEVMEQILILAGYSVVTARDGYDAMDVFEQRHEELRAVILDMTMPGLSGKEAYEQMRGITAAIPIVLASGYSEEEVIERIGDVSAPLFLQKPFQSKELLNAVDAAIRTTN